MPDFDYDDDQLRALGFKDLKKLKAAVIRLEKAGSELRSMGLDFFGASGTLQLRLHGKLSDRRACVACIRGVHGDGGDGGDLEPELDAFFRAIENPPQEVTNQGASKGNYFEDDGTFGFGQECEDQSEASGNRQLMIADYMAEELECIIDCLRNDPNPERTISILATEDMARTDPHGFSFEEFEALYYRLLAKIQPPKSQETP